MYIHPDKLFEQFETVINSASFRDQLFEFNVYVYQDGSHLMNNGILRVSKDGKQELGVFINGSFSLHTDTS